MIKYYSFHYGASILKVVKNNNFYSVILDRRVVASSDDLNDARKLFCFLVNQLVFDPIGFDIQKCIDTFDLSVVFHHHRNTYNRNLL